MRARFGLLMLLVTLLPGLVYGATLKTPRIESAVHPEKSVKVETSAAPTLRTATVQSFQTAAVTTSLGPNLIPNPSVETAGTGGVPSGWAKGGYGTNTRTLIYPVTGTGGAGTKAMQTVVSNYSNGDAKWFFNYVPVKAQTTYQISDFSQATVPSILAMQFKLADGTFAYKDVLTVPASAAFIQNAGTFVTPPNTVSLTVFHLLKQNGTLVTDDYSLNEVTTTTPPPPPNNLITNGDFETVGANGLPTNWIKGGYGTNTRVFTYPIAGTSGNGAKIDISGYTSGDAKWVFDTVPVTAGIYSYSDLYQSSVQTILTAQLRHTDGTLTYQDLKILPAASTWTSASADVTIPSDVNGVTIFHLLKSNGSLSLDSATLSPKSAAGSGIFSTGAVTFRFDDELSSQYTNAYPKLTSAGFKATFYVVSKQTADDGFADVMSIAQIKDLFAKGHEIGAHTRTHPDLTTLTAAQQQAEIQGSRQDILAWNVGPVLSFSYPYGAYNATTLQIVKDSAYESATSANGGYVTSTSDPYQLERQSIQNTTTLAQVQQWVDSAATNHQWLILEFHGIDTSGTQYSMTPTVFNQVVDYIKQKGIPVVMVSQGMQSM